MRHRLALTSALFAALLFAAALAVPALGGPSLSQIAKKAAAALKLAKAADARSKRALAIAKRGGATGGGTGQPGTGGAPGSGGSSGPAGPPGSPGPAGATVLDFRAPASAAAPVQILSNSGLVLTASCDAGGALSVNASTTVDHSELHVGETWRGPGPTTVTPIYSDVDDFHPGTVHTLTGGTANGNNLQGTFTYSTPAGSVVTGTFAAEKGAFGQAGNCWFGGWALHKP
jgi:hypothetical protein